MDSFGYILPEGIILLFVLLLGLGIVSLRRRLKGERAFTRRDYRLFFGHSREKMSFHSLAKAVILFSLFAALEVLLLAPLGAAILSTVMIVTLLAVVRFTLM